MSQTNLMQGREGREGREANEAGESVEATKSNEAERRKRKERHFTHPRFVSDLIIGLADGLTVPFALTAGLSSTNSRSIVIVSGLAELVSGAISMGLGGFLAASGEASHFDAERKREWEEVRLFPEEEKAEIYDILEEYGVSGDAASGFVGALVRSPAKWVDFMMRFELDLTEPETNRIWFSGLTIGFSYLVGGIIPLFPYFFVTNPQREGLLISSVLTSVVLFLFGFVKAWFVIRTWKAAIGSAFQALIVGALAAAASYGVVYGLQKRFA